MNLAIPGREVKKFENIELLAKQFVEGFITGLHKSPFHGFSVEFAEHRLYNTGESTRHIDWKVYGKTDKLFVKRYEEETNLRCHLLVDTSSSMRYPQKGFSKLQFSAMAAACLCLMMQKQRDAVSLTSFTESVENQTAVRSSGTHINAVLQLLQNIYDSSEANKQTSVVKTLHEIAEKIHRRSLVVIFSDMFDNIDKADEIFMALQHLKHKKHEVLLFHVIDAKTERHFDFEERSFLFKDLETGQEIELQPNQVRQHYVETLESFMKDLKLKCNQYKIDFIEADIALGYDQILSNYFVKRSKLK